MKHNANRAVVEGKRVVLIDDSIVRGTTSVKIVQMMRDAGAREVHFRISSPPIAYPDFYGIDTPERDKLLAARMDLDGMRRFIGADSLAFLSIDGIYRAMGYPARDPQPAAVHRPLLHRRLSDPSRRSARRAGTAATVAAGGGELMAHALLEELDQRIAVIRDNMRELTEQAAALSGAQDETRAADRIAEQERLLQELLKQRESLIG